LRGIQVVLLGEVGLQGGTCRAVQFHLPHCGSSTVVHVKSTPRCSLLRAYPWC
jgi:hypothetical protein